MKLGWMIVAALCVVALVAFARPVCADTEPRFSGELQYTHPIGSERSGFAGFGWSDRGGAVSGHLRLDGGPGSLALCTSGSWTTDRRGFGRWEDAARVQLEAPIAKGLWLLGGWERRYRIDESRYFAGARLTFGTHD